MIDFSEIEKRILKETIDFYEIPEGAYNFRINGKSVSRNSTASIDVSLKPNGKGLEIRVKPGTKNESVHIPVIITATGMKEVVENDFYIGENAEVLIIAGCGIYNCGGELSRHDGVHRLFVGKNAKVTYAEKHFGFGEKMSKRLINPTTSVYQEPGSEVFLELEQLKGVTSTNRITSAELKKNAKLIIKERLFTHGNQSANSDISVNLIGEDSTADIVSRAVAQDNSIQNFTLEITGEGKCRGHSECDAIIMDHAKVKATPSLIANSLDAELIHEAAIGKIAGEQIIKLMSLGLTRAEAESKIINGFLK